MITQFGKGHFWQASQDNQGRPNKVHFYWEDLGHYRYSDLTIVKPRERFVTKEVVAL